MAPDIEFPCLRPPSDLTQRYDFAEQQSGAMWDSRQHNGVCVDTIPSGDSYEKTLARRFGNRYE
jgi:hypothetical protein